MENTFMNSLIELGYTSGQISQLIKLESDGILLRSILDDDTVLLGKNISDFRDFRDIINDLELSTIQKNNLFDYFRRGLNYSLPFKTGKNISDSFFILSIMKEAGEKNIDISVLLDPDYTGQELENIWKDLKCKIDVSIYLDKSLTKSKRKLLREGLINGVNLSDLIKEFNFIKSDDIENLKKLIDGKYDFKPVLKKIKDTDKTLFVCEKQKEGVDIFPFINKNMSLEAMDAICEYVKKDINVSYLKSMNINSKKGVDILVNLHNIKFPLKYCKKLSVEYLNIIYDALKDGILASDIVEIIGKSNGRLSLNLLIACCKFEQKQYFDFICQHEINFAINKLDNSILQLLEYNFNHKENQINIQEFLMIDDKTTLDKDVFNILTKHIIKEDVDLSFIYELRQKKFDYSQLELIFDFKNKGYDMNLFLDNRLSTAQMNAIKTCLELGLEIHKNSEYDLPDKKSEKSDSSKYKILYSSDGYAYIEEYVNDVFKITYR